MGKDSGNASDDYYQVHLVDDVLRNSCRILGLRK